MGHPHVKEIREGTRRRRLRRNDHRGQSKTKRERRISGSQVKKMFRGWECSTVECCLSNRTFFGELEKNNF